MSLSYIKKTILFTTDQIQNMFDDHMTFNIRCQLFSGSLLDTLSHRSDLTILKPHNSPKFYIVDTYIPERLLVYIFFDRYMQIFNFHKIQLKEMKKIDIDISYKIIPFSITMRIFVMFCNDFNRESILLNAWKCIAAFVSPSKLTTKVQACFTCYSHWFDYNNSIRSLYLGYYFYVYFSLIYKLKNLK